MRVCSKVYELTLNYTQHWDHNVVTAALELLQQMLRTPPPELLHMLITAGSIPHATVFRQDAESRARSGSILELIGNLMNRLGQMVSKLVVPLVLRDEDFEMFLYSLTAWHSSESVFVGFELIHTH